MISEILLTCGALVHVQTMDALIKTESNYNPFAIAVVNGMPLKEQPKTQQEAELVIDDLEAKGLNYSVGLGQVNKGNFTKYNITGKQLLDGCTNIKISEQILAQCYKDSPNKSVGEALSCYYAGNFSYGYVREKNKGIPTAYVERVVNNLSDKPQEIIVPNLKGEAVQALAKVRDPKSENTSAKKSAVVLSAKMDSSKTKNKRLFKNVSIEQTQLVDTTKEPTNETQVSSTSKVFKF